MRDLNFVRTEDGQIAVIDSVNGMEVARLIQINSTQDFHRLGLELNRFHDVDWVEEMAFAASQVVEDSVSFIKPELITEDERTSLRAKIPELISDLKHSLREYGKSN